MDSINSNDAAAKVFLKLFWEAQNDHFVLREEAPVKGKAHAVAMRFGEQNKWKWVPDHLIASNLLYCRKEKEILDALDEIDEEVPQPIQSVINFLMACAYVNLHRHDESLFLLRGCIDDSSFDRPAYAWHVMGINYRRLGQFDEAMGAFKKSLAYADNDRTRNVWNSIGNLEKDKSNYDAAINAFTKSLALPGLLDEGMIWNNIGITYKRKGDLDSAVDAYYKSLACDYKEHRPGVFNGLGNVFFHKGDFEKSIEMYLAAVEITPPMQRAMLFCNLGRAYSRLDRHDQARDAYIQALSFEDPAGKQHKRARLGLNLLDGKLKPQGLTANDRSLLEKVSSEDDLEARLTNKITEAGGTKYDEYLTKKSSLIVDALLILRGWSSAMPLLDGTTRTWRGGGYFIKWRGHGMVIDPGFDFLQNLHAANIHAREISAIVISHNHPDHNYDFKAIDDLRYELYKRRTDSPPNNIKPYVLIWDEDTSRSVTFSSAQPEHHSTPITITAGFHQTWDLSTHDSKLPFKVTSFKVNHGHDVSGAMGMVVELLNEDSTTAVRLGYTGDTAYFPELATHLSNCDVLIAHISQPDLEEFENPEKFKDLHLGYRGVIKLIKTAKPKLTLIGEFWAGFSDLRIDLVKCLRVQTGTNTILPAGLGLQLKLSDRHVLCTECECQTAPTEIRVAPPAQQYGDLGYLCPNCMLL